jgi:acyl-coenzyme A synthetase/AMP-(fatty) acid ligase
MNNWFERILFYTRAQPETPAILMEDRVVTYAMLKAGIERCAARLVLVDVVRNGPVAVLVANPIRHMTLCLALHRIGVASLSLEHDQPDIQDQTFAAVLGDADARPHVDPANRVIDVTDEWFAEDLPGAAPLPAGFSGGEVCRMGLTSGTTGVPKRIMYRAEHIGQRILHFVDLNWSRALCLPGLSSNLGFTTACAVLATGRTLCFSQSPFQSIRMIELFSIDFVMASPEQVLALTRIAKKTGAHLTSLRKIEVGGSTATRAMIEAAAIYLCRDMHCRYGASETGVMARTPAREILSNPGLVGDVLSGVEIVIVDNQGRPCPAGAVGLVRCRISTGVDASERAAEQPWIDLGDIGRLDRDGRLFIFGRAADSMGDGQNRSTPGGSPVDEIEHLVRLEWDVADAAATMVEGGEVGSKPQIWIGVVQGNDIAAGKLNALAQARGIDYPIRLIEMQAIPRGANGKVNRQRLKAAMLAPANLSENS